MKNLRHPKNITHLIMTKSLKVLKTPTPHPCYQETKQATEPDLTQCCNSIIHSNQYVKNSCGKGGQGAWTDEKFQGRETRKGQMDMLETKSIVREMKNVFPKFIQKIHTAEQRIG